ncbi:cytochrome p450 protein [Diplodia corticola]|uniref:Cytochrome p450 protein n=1 Tax=Diplodia corticola TaxID=236234 RepID=A0A1J9QQM9_9PEZI|nr:cytochrome p450 protein [Diplodia corticola]OJD30760.1 cytochrome p450 protein [Diplodia corticola]
MFAAQLIALLVLAWAAERVVYNLFLHPLRDYPGPLLNRATPLPRMRARLTGRSPFQSHELHKRYGKVVRVSPNELSYCDGDAWKDIYGYGSKGSLPRDLRTQPRGVDGEPSLILTTDNEEHRNLRNVFSPAFSQRALKEQEPLLLKYINLFADKIHDVAAASPSHTVDITQFFNFATFDIMSDLAFGNPMGLLDRAEYTDWVRSTFAGIKLFSIRAALSYYIPLLDWLMPLLLPRSLQAKRKAHMKYAADQVHARLARGGALAGRPDIWTLVLRTYDGSHERVRLSMGQMESNASLFMVAGTETTATLLAGAAYLLATHPPAHARLAAELRAAFAVRADMTLEALQNQSRLPYLAAVVDEALRVYPPVPDAQTRRVPGAGVEVAGRWVPGGATVFVTQYAANRYPRSWTAPDEFCPERWLPEGEERFGADERRACQPFSVGPRNCLGMNLAYHEIRLLLAYLVWHFDFELCEESARWMDQKVFALWAKPPLMIKVTPVPGRWKE